MKNLSWENKTSLMLARLKGEITREEFEEEMGLTPEDRLPKLEINYKS